MNSQVLTALMMVGFSPFAVSGAYERLAELPYPLGEQAGVIRELDFAGSTVLVNGLRFNVAPDVQVEIDGSYGAFTMLQPGMRILYEYLTIAPDERRIILIQELPDSAAVDES